MQICRQMQTGGGNTLPSGRHAWFAFRWTRINRIITSFLQLAELTQHRDKGRGELDRPLSHPACLTSCAHNLPGGLSAPHLPLGTDPAPSASLAASHSSNDCPATSSLL